MAERVFSLTRADGGRVFSFTRLRETAAIVAPSGGILDMPRLEPRGITAREIAALIVPLFETGVFDA